MNGIRKLIRIVGAPARRIWGGNDTIIRAYRGYGSRDEAFVMGRVMRRPQLSGGSPSQENRGDWQNLMLRFVLRGIGGAIVEAEYYGAKQRVTTDRDGYFYIRIRRTASIELTGLWHRMIIRLIDPQHPARAEVDVLVAPNSARFVVISDIDDTVMHTGVANKLSMMWRLFLEGFESRVAFPGVAAFYRALHAGASGSDFNPMLYVSRAPWSIYEVLEAFFKHHNIPIGPVLFLREWGMTLEQPLPRRGKHHKLQLIRTMLTVYKDLPFVLIGDSGQRDPEIYTQIVREYPGRVLAIYIRNVSSSPERTRAIEALAEAIVDERSSLVLVTDALAMIEHAANHGLVARDSVATVARELEVEASPPEQARSDSQSLEGQTQTEIKPAIRGGDLEEAVEHGSHTGSKVTVEPTGSRHLEQ